VIVEFLIWMYSNVGVWAVGLIPAFSASGINSGLAAILGPVSTSINGLGAWLPWSTVQIWLPITISLYTGSLIVRAVKSFIPTIS
jgi:hypothetical protein